MRKTIKLIDDPEFEKFWAHYPKRVAKIDAMRAWVQIQPSRQVVMQMIQALEWQSQQPAWLKDGGQFVPYPASWLRAGRWLDEPVEPKPSTPRVAEHWSQDCRRRHAWTCETAAEHAARVKRETAA